MDIFFCQVCGDKLIRRESGDEVIPFCTSCSKFFFNTPTPCVIVIVMSGPNYVKGKNYNNTKIRTGFSWKRLFFCFYVYREYLMYWDHNGWKLYSRRWSQLFLQTRHILESAL